VRTASTTWSANQLEDASDPGRVNAFIETRDGGTPEVIERWRVSNDPDVDNAISATTLSVFDPSGATLPIETCSLVVENGQV
jgi:hypothetical protein